MERKEINGIILLNKPSGVLSNSVLNKVKKVLGVKKAGIAGTLDKFAEGLLIILLGRATKLFERIINMEKEYIMQVQLGEYRSTDDPYGKVVGGKDASWVTRDVVEKILQKFIGEIEQVPPLFSAVHIDGERAYRLALKGKVGLEDMKPRKVKIYSIELLDFDEVGKFFTIRVRCGRGTYMRALARDIGKALDDVGGYTKKLVRTKIGFFTIDSSVSLEEVERLKEKVVYPLEQLTF